MSRRTVAVVIIVTALTTTPDAGADFTSLHENAQERTERSGRPDPRRTAGRLTRYQVPAGSVLPARLVATLDSATAKVDDQIDATLTGAISQEGTELIPAGSRIIGKVVDVVAATTRHPHGRVGIAFYVVEHGGTRSLASLETAVIVFNASPPSPPAGTDKRKVKKQPPVNVQVPAEQPLTVRLAQPLIVYIPD